MEDLKVRKDINEIVKKIELSIVKTKKFTRPVCVVTLFNDTTIEFADKDGLGELVKVYIANGIKDFLISKKLVEDFAYEGEGESKTPVNTYVAVRYELKNGQTFNMFPSKRAGGAIIDVYYDVYKQKNLKKEGK